jgi:hypothetical protein
MRMPPNHVLDSDVPWENILALVEFVHDARKAKRVP